MQTVGIVGAGLIGCSWANVFARSGWKVRVWDPIESQRASAFQKIAGSLHDLAAVGLVSDAAAAQSRVEIVATLDEALDGPNAGTVTLHREGERVTVTWEQPLTTGRR